MFCSKCGIPLEDGVSCCPNCSAPVKSASARIVPPSAGKSFNFKDPRLLGAVAMVVAVILLFTMCFGGQSYKKAVGNLIDGVFDADAKQVLKSFPDKLIDQMCDEEDMSKKELTAYLNDELGDVVDDLDYYYGNNWSVSHKVTGTEKYDSDDLKWIKEEYAEIGIKVKDAKIVTVKMTIKVDGESQTTEAEFGVIKVGNSWYVDPENSELPF